MNINTDITRIYERNELIWGSEFQKKLFDKHIVIFGLGGVGSYTAEALARSGVGKLTFVDFDTVSVTNLNRQLPALISEIGRHKVDIMQERINNINPHIQVVKINDFYTPALNQGIFSQKVDFVADAIDSLRSKVDLIETCINSQIPIISSMGAGNRLDPGQLYVADISELKSKNCSFARNVCHKLKLRGITKGLAVVASTEKPAAIEKRSSVIILQTANGENIEMNKFTPGSTPFVPPVAGYMMASYIVRSFINSN